MPTNIVYVAPPTGDAATDMANIKAAIAAANAAYLEAYRLDHNAPQVTVQLAAGTYIVTGDQTNSSVGGVELLSGVALVGAGMGVTTIKLADDFNARINGIVRTALENVHDVTVANLTIDGNRANNIDHQAGFICGVKEDSGKVQSDITLSGVEIMNCTAYGFNPHEITSNVTIENCVAHDNGLDGFVADGVVGGVYQNNVAYNNDRHGFNIQNATINLDLVNNKAYSNGSAGAVVQRGDILRDGQTTIDWVSNIRIIGGEYYANSKEGILVKLSGNVTIDGVNIHHNLRQGVRIEGSTDTLLQNSAIFNNSQEAHDNYDEVNIRLRADAATGVTYYSNNTYILNNTIYSDGAVNARYGIREEPTNDDGGPTGTVVSGNVIAGMGSGPASVPGYSYIWIGTSGNDAFEGLSGGQEMQGLAGDDTYTVNHSGDVVVEAAGEGNDTVVSSINYTLVANVENLTLTGATAVRATGNELNNYLTGNALGNELEGKDGNDTLDGGAGADTMVGGNGNDTYYVDNAADVIVEKFTSGAGGVDEVYSSVSYILSDEIEKLTLTGSANLNATGNSDANILIGNSGNNILAGKASNDILDGAGGIDTALYDSVRVTYTVSGDLQNRTVKSASEGTDSLRSIEILQFVDGRVVYDVSDHIAQALRIYDAAFNRAPDTLGLNYWSAALDQGASLNDVASGFAATAEFQATYGALSNQGFVEQLYRNVLDREGDAGGISYWTGVLNAGAARGQILASFSESAELVENLRPQVEAGLWDQDETAVSVARLYYAALDRAPDAGGVSYWTGVVKGGGALGNVADAFAFSSEFQGKYGGLSNQQYVEQLYLNTLDRQGDAGGVSYWTNVLNSGGVDRGDILLGFSQSAEFQIKTQVYFDGGILIA